jgi:hypothetical protein
MVNRKTLHDQVGREAAVCGRMKPKLTRAQMATLNKLVDAAAEFFGRDSSELVHSFDVPPPLTRADIVRLRFAVILYPENVSRTQRSRVTKQKVIASAEACAPFMASPVREALMKALEEL